MSLTEFKCQIFISNYQFYITIVRSIIISEHRLFLRPCSWHVYNFQTERGGGRRLDAGPQAQHSKTGQRQVVDCTRHWLGWTGAADDAHRLQDVPRDRAIDAAEGHGEERRGTFYQINQRPCQSHHQMGHERDRIVQQPQKTICSAHQLHHFDFRKYNCQ